MGWRVQGATRCGWGSHYLCLCYCCLGRDNVAQSYHYWGRRQWSWLSIYTPCILGLVFHAAILPRHHPYVGHLKSMCSPIICCPARSRGTSKVPFGGTDAGWKPGRSKIGEKSSLLPDDNAASSSEDMSTTAGWREVTCMQRAYANSLQIGVASAQWGKQTYYRPAKG